MENLNNLSKSNYLEFIMLVGLPASGKSTWAINKQNHNHYGRKIKILSSDNVRYELYGDASIQGNPTDVFDELHKQVIDSLNNGYDVIYDATNLTIKNRKSILDKIKELKNTVDIRISCELFAPTMDIILNRNRSRDRVVPEDVIYSMRNRFQIPLYREGFEYIEINDDVYDNSKHWTTMFSEMRGFNQKNPNHDFDLFNHCSKCADYVSINSCEDDHELLWIASKLHDYGKLFTQTFDENGIAHYYNHENVGAYEVLSNLKLWDSSEDDKFDIDLDLVRIVTYINYHMIPFYFKNMSDKKKRYYVNLFGLETWNNLLLLHEADINSAKEVYNEE